MIIKRRVMEAKLAARINSNPDLARQFGLEMRTEKDRTGDTNLDNRISNLKPNSSTEAYE